MFSAVLLNFTYPQMFKINKMILANDQEFHRLKKLQMSTFTVRNISYLGRYVVGFDNQDI